VLGGDTIGNHDLKRRKRASRLVSTPSVAPPDNSDCSIRMFRQAICTLSRNSFLGHWSSSENSPDFPLTLKIGMRSRVCRISDLPVLIRVFVQNDDWCCVFVSTRNDSRSRGTPFPKAIRYYQTIDLRARCSYPRVKWCFQHHWRRRGYSSDDTPCALRARAYVNY
jgi:hypothetical protein